MLKWLILPIIIAICLTACSEQNPKKPQVAVLLAPAGAIVSSVAGDAADVFIIVPAGKDVHEYEPTPGDLKPLQYGGIYLSLDMQSEKRLTNTLKKAGAEVFELAPEIKRLPLDGGHHRHAKEEETKIEREFCDPHVWMSPENCALIAESCAKILSERYPESAEIFNKNAKEYAQKMRKTGAEIAVELAPYANRRFYVFHPAFGYFAKEFNLVQCPLEPAGKSPTPRELEVILSAAKKDNVTYIYASKEFNLSLPTAAAGMLNCQLELLEPLPTDMDAAFRDMTKKIKTGFEE